MEMKAREKIHHIIDLCSDICDKGVYTATVNIRPKNESLDVYLYMGEDPKNGSRMFWWTYAGVLEDWECGSILSYDNLKKMLLSVMNLEGEYAEDYQRSDVEDDAERDGGAAGDDSPPAGEDSGA